MVDVWVLQMCEKFGWSLADVQAMPIEDIVLVLGYMDGMAKIEAHFAQQHRRKK